MNVLLTCPIINLSARNSKAPAPPKIITPIQVDGSITESTTEISFSNTPLADVLNKISKAYKISINADGISLKEENLRVAF